jgi:hypothetical protein
MILKVFSKVFQCHNKNGGIDMKLSNLNVDELYGASNRARHKSSKNLNLETYFEEPIIHKEIQGDRVYVPLNLNRAWNKNLI